MAVGLENDGELSEPLTTVVQPDSTVYAGINMSCYKTDCGHWGWRRVKIQLTNLPCTFIEAVVTASPYSLKALQEYSPESSG